MIRELLNASGLDPKVAQRTGGCWDIVTAAGWMACRESAATALKLSHMAIKDTIVRRRGRISLMKAIHTDCSNQEARRALTRRFDLIPYTAADWQRQVSGRRRTAEMELDECQSADARVLDA
jgi:hypothetical protein